MTTETTFTREYFIEQCNELRERWAKEEFWKKEDCCETALKALGYVYLRLEDKTDFDETLWTATVDELSRRHQLMMLRAKTPQGGGPRGVSETLT